MDLSPESYRSIIDNLPGGIYVVDRRKSIIYGG